MILVYLAMMAGEQNPDALVEYIGPMSYPSVCAREHRGVRDAVGYITKDPQTGLVTFRVFGCSLFSDGFE